MSYAYDWEEAFEAEPRLEVRSCNIANLFEYRAHRKQISEAPLVVILHSATGDDMTLLSRTASWLRDRKGKLLVLIGNEYDLLPQKIAFLKNANADYVGTQLSIEAGRWLFEGSGAGVQPAAHALNPHLYAPMDVERIRDIGFVGDRYPFFIGDRERDSLIDYFRDRGPENGLRCEIRRDKIPRGDWAGFLASSYGAPGGESGTYFLEKNGETIDAVMAYLKRHPDAPYEEVWERFFEGRRPERSGKTISSRHFELIGTKTCQILIEGDYAGILKPDEHYIPVKKDLSDIDEALRKFRDRSLRESITERAYECAMESHTYLHRVEKLVDEAIFNS